jgi:hypothetical protein
MNGNKRSKNNNRNNVSHSTVGNAIPADPSSSPTDTSGILDERIRNLRDTTEEIESPRASGLWITIQTIRTRR